MNNNQKNTTMNTKELFKIGACCWLLADFLSDETVRKELSKTGFKKIYSRLKETKPEFGLLGASALTVSAVGRNTERYTNDIVSGRQIGEKAEVDAVNQFAESSQYLESWLDTLYVFDTESKKQALGDMVNKAVAVVSGKRKDDMTLLLEWLQTQPETVSKQTVFNKIIQIKNS